jgi:hypothetical protein
LASFTAIARDRGRAIGAAATLAASLALIASPAARGAGDPVASGSFKLHLSRGFKDQLRANGVKMKPLSPKLRKGSLDPSTGDGRLSRGNLTFEKGGSEVVYRKLQANLGVGGGIRGSSGRLFALSRGEVARRGFGAVLSGMKVKLTKSAARKLNRGLGLHSLHPGKAGSAAFSEQPQTVEVEEGTALVTPCPRSSEVRPTPWRRRSASTASIRSPEWSPSRPPPSPGSPFTSRSQAARSGRPPRTESSS